MSPALAEPPVFLVGQPRSGSTLLTRVLNENTGLFVINDFYVLQKIDGAGLWGSLTPEEATQIASWVFERIEIRATQESGKTLGQSIELTEPQLARVRSVARGPFGHDARWSDVLEAIMSEAARQAGCRAWGYNTPQDYLHLERLFEAFPEARVIYLLRAPERVLSSYKNASGPWHDARRYNPLTIGLAWRTASRSFTKWQAQRPGQVHFVRYEDLVNNQQDALAQLGAFLAVQFDEIDFASFGKNSSFKQGKTLRPVTSSELAMFEAVAGVEAKKRGYEFSESGYSLGHLPELFRVMATSMSLALSHMLSDRDRRRRIMRLLGFNRG